MSQLSPLISFDTQYIDWQHDLNVKFYQDNHESTRPWGNGKIYDSMEGIQVIAGQKVRTPGTYFATDPITGKITSRKLKDTQEFVHSCVRVRKDLGGLGTEDKGLYNPTSLVGYHLRGNAKDRNVRWEYGSKEGEPERILTEDVLGEIELKLLSKSPREYAAATEGKIIPK